MWQETRRPRSPTFFPVKKERSRSYSPHQCQIRRLYKALEGIETPHLDAILSRSPRSPEGSKIRGTLGGFESVDILSEKHVRQQVHEEKEVDISVPTKAAILLGYGIGVEGGGAHRTRGGRMHPSRTGERYERWRDNQNLSVTPPETPIARESFELEGDCSPLLLQMQTRAPDAVELPGCSLFTSVSWAGESRHELPTTPTDELDQSLKPQPLRLSKSSTCILPTFDTTRHSKAEENYDSTAENHAFTTSRRGSRSMHLGQPRPMTICTQLSTPPPYSASVRSQGLRKIKARQDLREGSPNPHESSAIPSITVTNPTVDESRQRETRAEKAREAGFTSETPPTREGRRWEEITDAADLKICMAVLAKEIARRKMEMRG